MIDLLEKRMDSFRADPLWHLLADRLKIRDGLGAILLAWIWAGLLTFVIPTFTGYLLPRPDIVSALEDWPTLLIDFLTVPLLFMYYIHEQPDMIRRLIEGLRALTAETGTTDEHRIAFDQLASRLAWRGWFPLVMMLACLGTLIWARDVLSHSVASYYSDPPGVLILHMVRVAVPLYMVIVMLVRHLVVTAALFLYFRSYNPQIYALHPDRCGGLAFLGRFSLRGAYLIAIIALNLSFQVLHNVQILNQPRPLGEVSVILAAIAYVLLAPLSFFLPLAPAHKGMSNAKIKSEKQIADEANKLYRSIQNSLEQGTVDEAAIARLEVLHRLSKLTAEFPVWPLDLGTLGRFAAAVALPVISTLILHWLEELAGWLVR